MMINKRLINVVPESRRYIAGNVFLQWCSLASNIALMTSIAYFLQGLYERTIGRTQTTAMIIVAVAALLVRFLCTAGASRMSIFHLRR